MSDSELSSDEEMSVDSVTVTQIVAMDLDEEERLCYLCRTTDDTEEWIDRSDLMDGAAQQRLVLAFERVCPPPWDEQCTYCDGEGCEECICEECERPMRHIRGRNYGCVHHPVI